MKRVGLIIVFMVVLFASATMVLLAPHPKSFSVTIGRLLYPVVKIEAKTTDLVRLEVKNQDPTMFQAVRIPELGVNITLRPGSAGQVEVRPFAAGNYTIEFYAGPKESTMFRYMKGAFTVYPSYFYLGSLALVSLTVLAVPVAVSRRLSDNPGDAVAVLPAPRFRFNLLSIGLVDRLLRRRGIQYAVILPCLLLFEMVILTGLFGTSFGPANFATVFVWTLWWFALIGLLVPFGARSWCTMCPLPAFGEWVQRGSLIRKRNRSLLSLGRRWPPRLRTTLLSTSLFVSIALFSEVITSNPLATAMLIFSMTATGVVIFALFERRTFCRYVCPIGGFIGTYSQFSPVELRVKDEKICLNHLDKECVKGNEKGYGCPWLTYPGGLKSNQNCGLCFECIKTCSLNNIALNLRTFGRDLLETARRTRHEAFTIIVMLSLAVVYSIVWFGPWEYIRIWALARDLTSFTLYAAFFLPTTMALMPALYFGATRVSRRLSGSSTPALTGLFANLSPSLVPIGITVWISFILGILSLHLSYVVPVVSDPFGWGWNLFGTKNLPWARLFAEPLPYVQVSLILIGLAYSIATVVGSCFGVTRSRENALRVSLPLMAFLGLLAALLIWIYAR